MNFALSHLSVLLLVSFSHFIPHSSLAIRKLEDAGIVKAKSSSDLKVMSFTQGDHVHRKYLHEVHSGPNPISNSIPQQQWETKLQGSP